MKCILVGSLFLHLKQDVKSVFVFCRVQNFEKSPHSFITWDKEIPNVKSSDKERMNDWERKTVRTKGTTECSEYKGSDKPTRTMLVKPPLRKMRRENLPSLNENVASL